MSAGSSPTRLRETSCDKSLRKASMWSQMDVKPLSCYFPLGLMCLAWATYMRIWGPWPQLWAPCCALDFVFGCLPAITPALCCAWWASRADPLPCVHCPCHGKDKRHTGMGRVQFSPCTNCSHSGFDEMWTWPLATFLRAVNISPNACSAPFSSGFYSYKDFPFIWVIPFHLSHSKLRERGTVWVRGAFPSNEWRHWDKPVSYVEALLRIWNETLSLLLCPSKGLVGPQLWREAPRHPPTKQPPLTCTPVSLQWTLC